MKKLKLIILLFIIFFLTGCYDNIELNNLAIISGIGIDYQNDNYILTYEILNDIKTADNATMKSYTTTGEGKTLPEAFTNTNYKVGKKPYFAHLKIVLFSENIVNNHLDKISDYLIRNTGIRDEFVPLALKSGITPESILKNNSDNIPVVSDFIINLIDNEKYNNNLAVTDLYQKFLVKLVSNQKDAIISTLTFNDDEITLSNFYTFKDYKKVNELSILDSSLYNMLEQNTFSIQFNKKYQGANFAIIVMSSSSDIKVTSDNINIKLKLKGRVIENNPNLDLEKQETYTMINKDFAEIIKNDVTNFIHVLQDSESDVLGLQEIYYKSTRKENNGLWKNANVNVDVDLKVNTKGFIFEVQNEE